MSDAIDRESLLIYLNDLRTMETIVYESEKKINEMDEKINTERNILIEYERKFKPEEPMLALSQLDSGLNSWNNPGSVKTCGIVMIVLGVLALVIFAAMGEVAIGVLCLLVALGIGSAMLYHANNIISEDNQRYLIYEDKKERYKEKLEKFQKDLAVTRRRVNESREQSTPIIESLHGDINFSKELLEKAYSANIIPLQFRNIQGIYYLYDYISTSNQSLSEALMQCNLEAIKEKLDNVIKLQSTAIIQQAEANAALYEQNQKILETAQATMNNTAVAAKYAQISAINSELSLKLQKKDLAYQRADFWLK